MLGVEANREGSEAFDHPRHRDQWGPVARLPTKLRGLIVIIRELLDVLDDLSLRLDLALLFGP